MKHKELYKQLIQNELNFLPDGQIELKSIYKLVQAKYGELCDDNCLCEDICTQGTQEAEWKHRVRTVIFKLKNKGIIKPGASRGYWIFGGGEIITPVAFDIPIGDANPERREVTTYRVLRDTVLSRKIKLLHQNKCQICGASIILKSGYSYSEAHHIKPLGSEHNGPDIAANVIVLCPNHHVMCDYGAIELKLSEIRIAGGHTLSEEYIEYHNSNIYGNGI
jgi:hypothetical protein